MRATLVELLRDPQPTVRLQAAGHLALLKTEGQVLAPAVAALLRNPTA